MNGENQKTYQFVLNEIQERNPTPAICEVGVGRPKNSIGIYLAQHLKTSSLTLVDPNPTFQPLIERVIQRDFSGRDVTYHKAAVVHPPKPVSGTIDFLIPRTSRVGPHQSAFVAGVEASAPVMLPKFEYDTHVVPCMTWDEIDTGQFEVLLLDVEGSEWGIIAHLVSRPFVITIEMEWKPAQGHKGWQNPHQKEIHRRLTDMGYACVHRGNGDWFYVRKG